MEEPKVTSTSMCGCGRSQAPQGVGIVCAGVCSDCVHESAQKFWGMTGMGVPVGAPRKRKSGGTEDQRKIAALNETL